MAAPKGNQNALKGKVWGDALRKALVQDKHVRLRQAIESLLDKAAEGEPWAIKELADRLDGKAAQSVELKGDADNPLAITTIERVIIDPKTTD